MNNPISQFNNWLEAALNAGIEEPNAMTLSTVSEFGKPSSRVVLLKGHGQDGFLFFTNYNSRKAKDIMANKNVALLFYWKELGQQVRVEGVVQKALKEESDKYFHSRPFESNLSALASPQSSVISGKEFLTSRVEALRNDLSDEKLERPLYWGGFRLIPVYFEFWQVGEHRMHHRTAFELKENKWTRYILAP